MCGIFGYIGNSKEGGQIVLNGLKNLEYRGYDSWGIGFLDLKNTEKLSIKKKTGKIAEISPTLFPQSDFSFGHTRWATHGGITEINAHPHLDCSGNIAVIHNGIIENYSELKKTLLSKKHRFLSETDSEVAVHLVEEHYNELKKTLIGKLQQDEILLEAVRLSFKEFKGLNAIIVMDRETKSFVACKNGSPLVIGENKDEKFIASDAHAILPYTDKVYYMEDDDLILIGPETVKIFHVEDGSKKKFEYKKIFIDSQISQKGNFPHFMLKEIYDQPKIINMIASGSQTQINKFAKIRSSSSM